MRGLRPLALTTTTVAVLAGCIMPFGDDDTGSGGSSPPSSSDSTTPDAGLERAGRRLSTAEAKAALPERPEGFTDDEVPTAKHRRTDPEVCVDLLRLGWHARNTDQKRTAEAGVDWSIHGDHKDRYQSYTIDIHSHSEEVGPGLLGRAGAALGECEAFSFTGQQSGQSFDERMLAEGLPVRNIGEQTFAVRLTTFTRIDGKTERGYVDQLDFRVGHNLVSVRSASYREGRSTQDLEEMAQEVLEKLEE